jgi:UDP-N-acetylmuramyl pentapeptide phosphotransferase/UDP-N-acetylglucosamine-1-phosphate transferase
MKTYAVVFFGSALLAIFSMPIVTRLARRFGLVDRPGVRKVHSTPVPRIGGVVLVLGTLALIVPVFLLDNRIGEAFAEVRTEVVVLLVASGAMFAVGLIDDLHGVRALYKLLALVAAALAVCLSGARIDSVSLGNVFTLELGWFAWPATILWIITITVGINFIDGLDGLAGGISAVACAVIAGFAFYSEQTVMAVLMLALLGSVIGFLFYNFNPAKVFMGDSGAFFLGFFISAASVVSVAKTTALVGLALPAAALGVPLFDTALTVVRRGVLDRRSVFAAERGHIHHRLLDRGLNQRFAVLVIYSITLLAAVVGVTMLLFHNVGVIAVLASVMAFLFLVFHVVGATRFRETLNAIRKMKAAHDEIKGERDFFQHAQLQMREAASFEQWWEAVCGLAASLGFERLALSVQQGDRRAETVVWRRSEEAFDPAGVITLSTPVRNGMPETSAWIDAAVGVNGSLESSGRRITLFHRLIDENNAAAMLAQPEPEALPPAAAPVAETEEKRAEPRLRTKRGWSGSSSTHSLGTT